LRNTPLDFSESGSEPAKVFRFEDIREAHRLMEINQASGKIVIRI
jgi:NADPH:quinone reductase